MLPHEHLFPLFAGLLMFLLTIQAKAICVQNTSSASYLEASVATSLTASETATSLAGRSNTTTTPISDSTTSLTTGLKTSSITIPTIVPTSNTTELPVVNLGYECHQAISLNETGRYFNFSNIRYAQAPIGNLRFREPIEPAMQDTCVVTNGSIGRVCPQTSGNWTTINSQFVPKYLQGLPFDYDSAMSSLPTSPPAVSTDPRTTEDCLFLDVITPQSAFTQKTSSLPVLVWVYGGGYSSGEKTGYGKFNPAGLLATSGSNPGFIFVTMNYRLGAFGFLGGDEVESDGTMNAGLYDQRLAFQWVQKYIHLFGGDKDRVTVMGASAGASSLMHHVTSFGGVGEIAFNQAIMFSPAFLPYPTSDIPTASFNDLMNMLNVSSLEEMRQVPSETLIATNARQIYSHAPYGSTLYGPTVDGIISPALPGQLLADGSFHQNFTIMVAHNTLEGLIFTKPSIKTSDDYLAMLRQSMPQMLEEAISTINNTLYPAVFDGTYGYTDEFQRALVTIQDSVIDCNPQYLARAMPDSAYSILFAVPPGIHGEETAYIFQNGATSGVDTGVADKLQRYIVSFVMNSVPAATDGTAIPTYGATSNVMKMQTSGSTVITDDTSKARCSWWQQGNYA